MIGGWRRRSGWRWLAVFATGLLIGAVATRLCMIRGLTHPIRVSGGSMAPALYGEHQSITCGDCGFPFRCDATRPSLDGNATCPNCGNRNPLEGRGVVAGQRVLVDPYLWPFAEPQRWDLIAFQDPTEPKRSGVKRVVGLPNEQIALREGDLYVDGQLVRKSLDVQRRVAVLVHDDRFRPPDARHLPRRWRTDLADSPWQAFPGGYRWTPPPEDRAGDDGATTADDWLTYRHWRCYAGPYERTEESPPVDNYGYNQGVSRQMRPITDLYLEARFTLPATGRLTLLVSDGRQQFRCDLDRAAGQIRLARDGALAWQTARAIPGRGLVEYGVFDRQIVLALDRHEVFRIAYEPPDRPRQPTSRPLAIRASGAGVEVTELCVFRDLYYLDPQGLGIPWEAAPPLGDRQWLVLGDNAPISEDGRHWPLPALQRPWLTGRVLEAF
jgi:signal peptidase I